MHFYLCPWGPPSLLYNGHWVSFPGVKLPGRSVDHPPPCSAEVKERIDIHLYFPSEPSWPVLGELYIYVYLYFKKFYTKSLMMVLIRIETCS
jgi:hypothetical protein